MTVQVIREEDSIQQWISNLNKTFDISVGQFHIEQRTYSDLTLEVTGGRYKRDYDVTVQVYPLEITFSGQGTYYVGLDLDEEEIAYYRSTDTGPLTFMRFYTIQCSATRILSVLDERVSNYVINTEIFQAFSDSAKTSADSATASAATATSQATIATTKANEATASAALASAIALGVASGRPAIRPSLLLDFANSKVLDPRITFTRASNSGGYYDGVTTAKAEENLLRRSQEFDNAYWQTASNVTITANSAVAPDGTTTADTMTESATTATHRVAANNNASVYLATLSASLVFTISCCYKVASGAPFARLSISDNSGARVANAWFDLSAGTAASTGTIGAATVVGSSITALGSGWYRCTLTASVNSGQDLFALICMADADLSSSYLGSTGRAVHIWGAQLEQRSFVTAYTATTTQPITNYIPKMLFAANDVPVFGHNPTTGESLGLGVWESRTNLLTYSDQFSNAAWTKNDSAISANVLVAPDGTLTADKLYETATTNTHNMARTASVTSGTTYTVSVFLKAAERGYAFVAHGFTAFAAGISVNLSTGVATNAGAVTGINSVSVGNGWWRVSYSVTATGTGTGTVYVYTSTDGVWANRSYAGDGYSGIYVWGAQLEAGTFATPYIPTVASQVTRAADSASMTGTNFSSWYNQAEGTFFFTGSKAGGSVSFPIPVIASDGTDNNRLQFYLNNSTGRYSAFMVSGGTNQADVSPAGAPAAATAFSIAAGFKVNSVQCSLDGVLGTEDTAAVMPIGVNQLGIGNRSYSASQAWSGHIRKLAYYPLRISDTALQALTR